MQNMKSLDHHFRHITRSVFEHYGFAHGELVAQWAAIVGDDTAKICSPVRMAWPNGRDKRDRHTEGATLTVHADQGAALALSYQATVIVDRINSFFGYHAVAKLKIVQRDRAAHNPGSAVVAAEPTPDIVRTVQQKVGGLSDSDLKAALARLGNAALAKAADKSKTAQPSSQQRITRLHSRFSGLP